MKKNLVILPILLVSIALVSCDTEGNNNLYFYKSKYDNGQYFECLKETESSDNDVFVTIVAIRNETNASVAVETKDFTIKVNNESYPCKFFVKSWGMKSSSSSEMISYVKESSTYETIESSETTIQNLQCAFDVDGQDNFNIYYKGAELKLLGA